MYCSLLEFWETHAVDSLHNRCPTSPCTGQENKKQIRMYKGGGLSVCTARWRLRRQEVSVIASESYRTCLVCMVSDLWPVCRTASLAALVAPRSNVSTNTPQTGPRHPKVLLASSHHRLRIILWERSDLNYNTSWFMYGSWISESENLLLYSST